eukprot:TRINITY_DN19261_c0_g1_i1.p1 TRINITY_DN19261_c0_g1~~TRINITY_DN19261_c0_g1_i1.p1  ORF type:complete len:735 (+),score=215.29 TRINITY_DN19261_c0_g1_i1:41-2245(+)
MSKIIYTYTDEAPMLATYALLPIIQRFAKPMGIEVERKDISVAGRILAQFPDYLTEEQRQSDDLTWLGELAKTPEGNIIKLPNISASVPQLLEAIAELQAKGYKVPDFNQNPANDKEMEIKKRYGVVLGSAVNPVLREGNSDRRCAPPVKAQAKKQTKRSPGMKPWSKENRSYVAHMTDGDFFGSEQSHIMQMQDSVQIVFKPADGEAKVLKPEVKLEAGEVIDATCMNKQKLCAFFDQEIQDCKAKNLMMSLHMKATMMKVSDPIIFGHCVKVYYKDVFEKHGALFSELGVNPNNGLGDVYDKVKGHPKQAEVEADIQAVYSHQPGLAMVDSSKGITNLHVPSDVIIDASMPCVVRDGGAMWNKNDKLEEVKCLIPDRSYSTMYQAVIEDCKENGQFDWTTMGHTSNIGLMAKKAEEYGSHDKTFELPAAGTVQVVSKQTGKVIFSHEVQPGDIWRMCQTKDAPIRDWVKLAVSRARASGAKAIFWLDPARAHDRNIVDLASKYLMDLDTTGLDIKFLTPVEAMKETCKRARAGQDTISVTGNVLRDYLTDLFPILELGTSAKMLSIVPLLAGGRLLETGAGGSAPKHVEQFLQENHLRWDSLGEYLATAIAFQELGTKTGNEKSTMLGDSLMEAVGVWLESNKSPGRKVKELDNRGSNYYLCLYWAEALAKKDSSWQSFAQQLRDIEEAAVKEMLDCQGVAVDIGGYYKPVDSLASAAMRPSATFNNLIDNM